LQLQPAVLTASSWLATREALLYYSTRYR